MPSEFDSSLGGKYHEYEELRPQEDDGYRSVSALSTISFTFGCLSILAFLNWMLLVIPVLTLIFGFLSIQKIVAAPKITSGLRLTLIGVGLAVVFGIFASFWLYWSYYNLVPSGYKEVEFLDFAASKKTGAIPEEILALNGQHVYVSGHIFATGKPTDINEFMLVRTLRSNVHASPTKNPTDMIHVKLIGGNTIAYTTNLVRVGGILKVTPNYDHRDKLPYFIEADFVR